MERKFSVDLKPVASFDRNWKEHCSLTRIHDTHTLTHWQMHTPTLLYCATIISILVVFSWIFSSTFHHIFCVQSCKVHPLKYRTEKRWEITTVMNLFGSGFSGCVCWDVLWSFTWLTCSKGKNIDVCQEGMTRPQELICLAALTSTQQLACSNLTKFVVM